MAVEKVERSVVAAPEGDDRYYVAVLLYESSSDAPDYEPLYQESFVLIRASSREQASQKAHERARLEEGSYKNEAGETITWSLKYLVDVNEVLDETLGDGADLYARHFRNYEAYRQFETLREGEPSE